jgi:hypothetical protein
VRISLLGPQRRPTVDAAARSLGTGGPVATITAGWQEREPDDKELTRLLGARDVNLQLYRRWLDVLETDPGYAAGEARLQAALSELNELYLVRLGHALQAAYTIQAKTGGGDRLASAALADAVAAVRELDAAHLYRVGQVRGEFFDHLRPHDREVIAGHRAAIGDVLAGAATVVLAGGRVDVLAHVLHLFNVAAAVRSPVIAWSAGAMALAERIVLFGDRAPQGPGHAELHGSGLSLVRGAVLLPHARARLRLDDAPRMAMMARRFAPDRCVLLDPGARVDTDGSGSWPPGTRVLGEDGQVTVVQAAA